MVHSNKAYFGRNMGRFSIQRGGGGGSATAPYYFDTLPSNDTNRVKIVQDVHVIIDQVIPVTLNFPKPGFK